jgi:hypothetical protein
MSTEHVVELEIGDRFVADDIVDCFRGESAWLESLRTEIDSTGGASSLMAFLSQSCRLSILTKGAGYLEYPMW